VWSIAENFVFAITLVGLPVERTLLDAKKRRLQGGVSNQNFILIVHCLAIAPRHHRN
jgi:hypothetical protein